MRGFFDAIAAAGLMAMFGLIAINWGSLPGRIPVDFGFTGTPDRWSTPGSSLLPPFAGLFLFGLGPGRCYEPRSARHPRLLLFRINQASKPQ